MARRRSSASFSEDRLFEMVAGPLFTGVMKPRECQGREWCPKCRTGFTCESNCESEQEREKFYWSYRDEIFSMDGATGDPCSPGSRPWSYWAYEAPGVCRCEPRCQLPGRLPHGGTDWDGQRDWLDRHGELSGWERTQLARWDTAREGV